MQKSSNLLTEHTYDQQRRLADYCRTGELSPIEGLTPNRVENYRRLVSNIVSDSLESAYPLTYNLLDSIEWTEWVHEFFSTQPLGNPQVMRMPFEFLEFTREKGEALTQKYPFLLELMEFEWTESDMYIKPDEDIEDHDEFGDITREPVVLNPEMRWFSLEWPIHTKPAPDIKAEDKGEYYCLAYRDLKTGAIHFNNLGPLLVVLLENLKAGHPFSEILEAVSAQIEIPKGELEASMTSFLRSARDKGIVLGTKKPSH
jgi:hypothetical protein